jgi:hypothetical protein
MLERACAPPPLRGSRLHRSGNLVDQSLRHLPRQAKPIVEADVEATEPGVALVNRPAVKSARIPVRLTVAVEAQKESAAGAVAEFVWLSGP